MTNTPATICIYHANCADGFGAAWVVRRLCPDAEFYAAKHGEPAPDTAGKHVVIVDFSYPLDVLQQMATAALSVLVIDHHKTAQEALASLPPAHPDDLNRHQLAAVFDMNRSGAGLTWDFFYPGQPRPALINHIEDRDLWRFQLEGTREILANLFSHPQDFGAWDELMARPVAELRAEGAAIERAQQKELGDLLRATQRRMVIAGHDVPTANLPFTKASDAGNIMCRGEPFAAIYWDTPDGRQFSLRSTDAGEDVSVIAKQFGGGGHRNAAGFNVTYGHELTQYDATPEPRQSSTHGEPEVIYMLRNLATNSPWRDADKTAFDCAAFLPEYERRQLVEHSYITQLHAEIDRLQGLEPEWPPRPPEGNGLPRFGVRWNGPQQPVAVPMPDGYWTPWHLTERIRAENAELEQADICWAAVINYMLGDGRKEEPLEFLQRWNDGDFDALRKHWPDAPQEIYLADPLAAEGTAHE